MPERSYIDKAQKEKKLKRKKKAQKEKDNIKRQN
jgi:hypothetical protein